MRIFYSRHYNIGLRSLQRLHPFDLHKFSRAAKAIKRAGGREIRSAFSSPARNLTDDEALLTHTPGYLQALRSPQTLAKALEVPLLARFPRRMLDWLVVNPMRWAAQGTVDASAAALDCGLAVNIGGGFHHAKPDRGEGFCLFNDIAIAIRHLREGGLLADDDRVAVIDLDAHMGNGVAHCFRDDTTVFLFDMHNGGIYPWIDSEARHRIDCCVPVKGGITDEPYLQVLRERLPGFLDSVAAGSRLKLAIYNAGTDVIEGDELGLMDLTPAGVRARDRYVLAQCRDREIPLVMVTSGGYTSESYKLIAASVVDAWSSCSC